MALNLWPGKQTASMVGITSLIAVFLALGNSGLLPFEIGIISLIATFQTVALLLLTATLSDRVKRIAKYSPLLLLLFLALIGSSRGWLIFELANWLGASDAVAVATRVLNSTITIVIWGYLFSLIEARLKAFRENFQEQFAQRAVAIAAEGQLTAKEIARSIDELDSIKSLQANLRQIADAAEGQALSHAQLIVAAQKIRSEIESSLRPLSRRMWFDSSAAQPKFHIWELLKESLRNLDLRWYPTSALVTIAFFFGSLSLYDPLAVAIRIGFYGAALSLLLVLLEKFQRWISGSLFRGAILLVGVSVLANLIGEVAVSILLYGQLLTTDPLLALVGPAATIGILWVEAAFAQMRKDWAAVSTKFGQSSSNVTKGALSSRLAGYLHNSLQSQLSGIALALETTNPADASSVAELVNRLKEISTKSIGDDFAALTTSPIERISAIAKAWKGIADISYEIPRGLEVNPKLGIVVELVEEAINNAIRHSKASSVDIRVSEVPLGLRVTIAHPAVPQKSGKSRLGQLWLERFSQEHRVEYTSDGKRLLTVII